mgnify:CR=1 FL=1
MTSSLNNTKSDMIASAAKGIFGAIPIVGPLAVEVVGTLIPNQRLDRIQRFLEALERRVQAMEAYRVKDRFKQPEVIDLLEDAFYSSGRTLSEDRIQYIADLVGSFIEDETIEHIQSKKLLSILSELNDAELLILIHYGHLSIGDHSFADEHANVVNPTRVHMQSSIKDREKAQLHDSYKRKLVETGMLKPRFKKPKKGDVPEFDEKTGMIKATGFEITPLGRLLLAQIGQMPERKKTNDR